MADAPKILGTDTLRQAYPKINAAIDNANEALNKATTAETNSTNAVNTANSVQQQLNQIVIEGDSSVEAAQARVDAEGNVYTTLKERIDAEQIKIGILNKKIESIVSVKEFGARGDGVTDDTQAIQNAINYCASNDVVLYVPKGDYVISSTLSVNNNPDPNSFKSITIVGSSSSIGYNGRKMKSNLISSTNFNGTVLLDLRYTEGNYIAHLGLFGNGNIDGIELGSRNSDEYGGGNHTIYNNCIHGFKNGIIAKNSGVNKIKQNDISNCSNIGIYLKESAGDSDIEGNYINTNNPDYIGTNLFMGSGIVISTGSNNINIRGGKIEWNAKGIIIYASQGINIEGIQFDVNRYCHIHIESPFSETSVFATSILIKGNRFLAGGTKSFGTVGGSHISITGSGFYKVSATITGNTFKKGGDLAYDNNNGNNIGPDKCVRVDGNVDANIQITNNDMTDAFVNQLLYLYGQKVKVLFEQNQVNGDNSYIDGGAYIYALENKINVVTYGSAPPTSGTWKKGDKVINTNPSASSYIGWICIAAGTPGTWKGFGQIQA